MGMPSKQREYSNRFFDSTVWNDFAFRDDDVVIASYAKAGTTWVQQIVAQLDLRRRRGDRRLAAVALVRLGVSGQGHPSSDCSPSNAIAAS